MSWQWAVDGCFERHATDITLITFRADLQHPPRTAALPYPAPLMESITDWTIENNWSICQARLVSKSKLLSQPLLPLFLAKFGEDIELPFLFTEIKSFEEDGVSMPDCFKSESQLKKEAQEANASVLGKRKRGAAKGKGKPCVVSLPPRPLPAERKEAAAPSGTGLATATAPDT